MLEYYWKRSKKLTTFAKKTWKLTLSEKPRFIIWQIIPWKLQLLLTMRQAMRLIESQLCQMRIQLLRITTVKLSMFFLWLGVVLMVIASVLLVVRYIWKKNRSNEEKAKQDKQDASLRYELLKHKDIYKKFCQKGYFSTVRKPNLEVVEEHEINELCEAVSEIFTSFIQFLSNQGLSAKDYQFCCLLKSGLTTLELAEIYCVSESAIFKRRQKIKNQLGFESENRTLDEIFEEM